MLFGILPIIVIGIVHGDLKPENILVAVQHMDIDPYDYVLKLIDFGFSPRTRANDPVFVSGTKPWTAPEHHGRGHTVQGARLMDLFSFGMLCFWMLFRDLLWPNSGFEAEMQQLRIVKEACSFAEVFEAQLRDLPEIPRQYLEQMKHLIGSTLHRVPNQRVSSLRDLLGELQVSM